MQILQNRLYALLTLLILTPLSWGSVTMTPSDATLSSDKREASFILSNDTSSDIDVNLSIAPWLSSYRDDVEQEKRLLKNKALLAYPPVARVERGGQQVFRVILRDKSVAELHLFRLNVAWKASATDDEQQNRVSLQPGYSFPLFVTAPNAGYQLQYHAVRRNNDDYLVLKNHGEKPVYVKAYRRTGGEHTPFFAYAWPGKTRTFKLPTTGDGDITLQLRTYGWTKSQPPVQQATKP